MLNLQVGLSMAIKASLGFVYKNPEVFNMLYCANLIYVSFFLVREALFYWLLGSC